MEIRMDIGEYHAQRERRYQAFAALARQWAVDAVGRGYPDHVTMANGCRVVRVGKWYVVQDGKRIRATAAQARKLNAIGSESVGAIGPHFAEGPGHI